MAEVKWDSSYAERKALYDAATNVLDTLERLRQEHPRPCVGTCRCELCIRAEELRTALDAMTEPGRQNGQEEA